MSIANNSSQLRKSKIVLYTKDPCPYCVRAIRFLHDRNLEFTEVDLTDQPDEIDRIKNETGWRTVPIILINNRLVGGYTDLVELDERGELESWLAAE